MAICTLMCALKLKALALMCMFAFLGWTLKTKTNFEKDSPIFILGRCYHRRPDGKPYIDVNRIRYCIW